ncbi:hypothetical protein BaRGS_00036781 [Batillaria attramentaria]|uniref:Uncharacterized protein n=1 Tax=Batillaria attramentaria TaxID=370345 RepID=A0ABD0JBX7_9CAEN
MASLFTLFAVCLAAMSVAMATDESTQGSDPGIYCVPEAWQGGRASTIGTVSTSTGESSVKRTIGNVIYSAKLKKMIVNEYGWMGGKYVMYLFDWPAKLMYTLTGDVHRTCTKTPLTTPFKPQCVPVYILFGVDSLEPSVVADNSNMTMLKSYYGVGKNTQFAMELSGIQQGVFYRVSMTYDRVPIFEELWGTQNGREINYYNQ